MSFLITAITGFLIHLINVVLTPINDMIANALPSLSYAIAVISDFFTWLCNFINWVISFLPFTPAFWSWFIAYWIFRLTIPLLAHTVKLAVKWWHALAP